MTNPTRVADGMSSHVVYTVNTTTTHPSYSYSQCTVIRRYSDFLWLHDILSEDYPYAIIPPMPEKNTMNRFEIEFVESRVWSSHWSRTSCVVWWRHFLRVMRVCRSICAH